MSDAALPGAHLSIRRTLVEAASLYARHWKLLAPVAVAVLLPQAVLATYVGEIEIEHVNSVGDVLKVIAIPGTLLVNLAGEALLAGMITALVREWRSGSRAASRPRFLVSLPWLLPIGMDLLLALGTAVGFLLLVLPGLGVPDVLRDRPCGDRDRTTRSRRRAAAERRAGGGASARCSCSWSELSW